MISGVTLVPRRMKTVGRFVAADPWNANAQADFTIEAYRLFGQRVRVVRDTKWLGLGYLYGISSALDGRDRIMPDALAELWRTKQVAPEDLPSILYAIEPELKPADFRLWAATRMHWWFAAACGLVALICLIVAARAWPKEGWAVSGLPSDVSMKDWLAMPMQTGHRARVRYEGAPAAGIRQIKGIQRPARYKELQEEPDYRLAWLKDNFGHRLVLVGGYGRMALPRIFPDGIVVPAAETGLDPNELRILAQTVPGLNIDKIFWHGLYRPNPGSRTDVIVWVNLAAFLALSAGALCAFVMWKKRVRKAQMDQWRALAAAK